MPLRKMMVVFLGVAAMILLATSGIIYFERPTTLRVAVSKGDGQDADLIEAAAKLLKRGHHNIRLKSVPVDNVDQAAAALDAGKAELSVVRADEAMPAKGDTVVVLRHSVALLVAPNGSSVEKIGDLSGKRIGTLSQGAGDDRILDAALSQYDVSAQNVKLVRLAPAAVGEAIAQKTVDAVFVVGLVSEGQVPEAVRAIAKAGEGPPVFLPVAEAAAIAQRSPAYESVEVVRGAFGGTPPRPAEEFDTLGITYRLVASTDVETGVVSTLTEFLLSQRVALAKMAPIAQRMEAPSTDKGAAMPVHPGTAAYIDDDEETFLDQYSDLIYIGAMVLGVLASGMTAVASRFGPRGGVRPEDLVTRLLEIFRLCRTAPTSAALDMIEDEVDDLVASALDESCLRNMDERRVAALNMAVGQVRTAIRDRRNVLRRSLRHPANDQSPLVDAATLGSLAGLPADRSVSEG